MVTGPPEAVSKPSNAPTASTLAVTGLIRVRMLPSPYDFAVVPKSNAGRPNTGSRQAAHGMSVRHTMGDVTDACDASAPS
jgi:hypothetical protein